MHVTTPEQLLRNSEETTDLLYKLSAMGILDEMIKYFSREQRERMRDVCDEIKTRLTSKTKSPYA